MRKRYERCLRTVFCRWVRNIRAELEITQQEMAAKLYLSGRSYADLESGASCCGTVTLVVFLTQLCEDPDRFLQEVREAVQEEVSRLEHGDRF